LADAVGGGNDAVAIGDVRFDGGESVAEFIRESGDPVEPTGQQGDVVAVCCQGAAVAAPMPDDAPVTTATLSDVLLVIVIRPPGSLGRSFPG
jgi:hypothetical protein